MQVTRLAWTRLEGWGRPHASRRIAARTAIVALHECGARCDAPQHEAARERFLYHHAGLGKTTGFAPARSLGATPTNSPFCHWPTPNCLPRMWVLRSIGPTMVWYGPPLTIVSSTFLRSTVRSFSVACSC